MDVNAIIGKTPEDFLPPRVAETVTENYIHCIKYGETYRYEEVLTLPKGEFWWQTTLEPVFSGGKIIGILGVAHDITDAKQTEKLLAESLDTATVVNSDLTVVSTCVARDLRAPLEQVSDIKKLVMEGFEDLGDNKLQLLAMGKDLIDIALSKLDEVVEQAQTKSQAARKMSEVDLGKWSLDILALIDPLKKFDAVYPSTSILCEKFILDIALRNLLCNACKHGVLGISLDVQQVGDNLIFTVQDDGEGFPPGVFTAGKAPDTFVLAQGGSGKSLANCMRLIFARGGELWIEETADRQRGGMISFKIPGQMLEPQSKYLMLRAA